MEKDRVQKGHYTLVARIQKTKKAEPNFGLEKIPIEGLYKYALIQIGEQESYIQEMEERLGVLEQENAIMKSDETKLSRLEMRQSLMEARKQAYVSQLEHTLEKQTKIIKKLQAEISRRPISGH